VGTLSATETEPELSEPTPIATTRARAVSPRALTWIRRTAVVLWAAGVIVWTARDGVAIDRGRLVVMVCAGLIAATIGRRSTLLVIRDWLPFAAVLFVYDLSRGAAALLGRPTEWHFQIEFDRWLFAGTEPTVWLQAHIKAPYAPWWEVAVSLVYVSYFIAPYAVAGLLWLRNRAHWRKFVLRYVVMSFIGLIGFIVVPAAPPWAASQCTAAQVVSGPSDPGCLYAPPGSAPNGGLLGPSSTPYLPHSAPWIERISNRGWLRLGLPAAQSLIDEGQAGVNQVAAIPSLHAATTLLISIFLWPRVRRRWRPLILAYPVIMGFVLVYSAEHFVLDILLGWLLAGAVALGFSWWERFRESKEQDEAAEMEAAGPDSVEGPQLART
jgi:hypothetical protein